MNIPVKVHIENDVSLGILCHCVLVPPAIWPPTISPSLEFPVNMKWPPGFFMNQNKLTTTVKHKCMTIVQDGHDCGTMIPDLTYVVVNAWYLTMWPLSKREIIFAASSVNMDKVAVGCAQVWPGPLPFMTCGEPISAPTALPITSWLNTLRVNMTGADLLMGIAKAAISMAIDFLFHKLGGAAGPAKKAAKEAGKKALKEGGKKAVAKLAAKEIGKNLLKQFIPIGSKKDVALWFAKKGLTSVSGFLLSLFTDDPTLKIGTGMAGLKGEVAFRSSRDGTRDSVVGQGNLLSLQGDTSDDGANRGQGSVLGSQGDTSGDGANRGQGSALEI